MKTSNIFAIDVTTDEWNIPFIRLGCNKYSNSIVSDILGDDSIAKFEMPLDMATSIWWVYKHHKDFGFSDYIGICHYRRFFSHAIQYGMLPTSAKSIDINLIANSTIQTALIEKNNVDGILTFPWKEDFYGNPASKGYKKYCDDYTYQYEGTYYQLLTDNEGLSFDEIKMAYDMLFENSPDWLKPHVKEAFKIKTIHFCSIFTISKDIFDLYANVVLKTLFYVFVKIDRQHVFADCNCRVGGYLLERIGSCFFDALQLSGKKFMCMPIIELRSGSNPIYRSQTCKDINMKVDQINFKTYVDKEFSKN